MIVEVHCAACSNQGKNIGSHSLVAKLDLDKLIVPIRGNVFDSPAPERHVGKPWLDVPWYEMFCPRGRHLIWKAPYDEEQLILVTNHEDVDVSKYTCPVCGKQFKTKRQIHAHSLKHT